MKMSGRIISDACAKLRLRGIYYINSRPDYRVVFVGDAAMSPYEIAMKGGAIEHWNEEAGAVWLNRFVDIYHI